MRTVVFLAIAIVVLMSCPSLISAPDKEYLTPLEITKIQDNQEIDIRIRIYLDAARLRLRASQERLGGKESAPGDPLEFFTVEDMLEGYWRIMRSVMFNIDDAARHPRTEKSRLSKALRNLKESTEKSANELEILKQLAEDKRLEKVWDLVNRGIDITKGAHDGAELGLAREPEPKAKKR